MLGIPGGFVEGADKVRISVTNPNMSFLPSGVALKKGFFKDEGLEAEIIRMNVPNIITALVTGDIGYTLIFGSVVRGALRGMPMRALASLLDGSTHALVAKPEYKSGKELKGKIVGIGNFGGTELGAIYDRLVEWNPGTKKYEPKTAESVTPTSGWGSTGLVTVTVTPGMGAPWSSTTFTRMLPVCTCAHAGTARTDTSNTMATTRNVLNIG